MNIIDNDEIIFYKCDDYYKYPTPIFKTNWRNNGSYMLIDQGKINCIFRENEKHIIYYKNGICHRDNDLPAIEYINSNWDIVLIYVKNNKIHRDNNLPAIVCGQLGISTNLTPEQARKEIIDNPNIKDFCMHYYKYGEFIEWVKAS